MKVIFLGLMFSHKSLEEAYAASKCGMQMAPHLFQKKLTDGLSSLENVQTHIVNIPPVGSFPMNYKKLYVKGMQWDGNTQIGYWNIPGLKWGGQKRKMVKTVRQILSVQPENEECCLIAYHLHEPFLDVIGSLKKEFPNLHTTLIQTDAVPGRGGMIKGRKMEILGNRLVKKAKVVDSFALLTRPMRGPLEVGERPFVIIECICDPDQPQSARKETSDNIFLYSGTTEAIYGIRDVVDAIKQIPNAQLWICGAGNSDDYIKETAKTHKNIRHFGYVDQKRLSELRDQCDFLINPRRPTGTYTKYSFPSKTAEYMMSGKPVVMYKLEGIPDEYNQYLNYLTAETPQEIKQQIQTLIQSDYAGLVAKAVEARAFIQENKNAQKQARKIMEMILA